MKHGVLSIGVVQIDFHELTNSDNSDDSAGSSLTFTQRLHSLRMAQLLTTNQCAGGVNGLSELGNLWLSNSKGCSLSTATSLQLTQSINKGYESYFMCM